MDFVEVSEGYFVNLANIVSLDMGGSEDAVTIYLTSGEVVSVEGEYADHLLNYMFGEDEDTDTDGEIACDCPDCIYGAISDLDDEVQILGVVEVNADGLTADEILIQVEKGVRALAAEAGEEISDEEIASIKESVLKSLE